MICQDADEAEAEMLERVRQGSHVKDYTDRRNQLVGFRSSSETEGEEWMFRKVDIQRRKFQGTFGDAIARQRDRAAIAEALNHGHRWRDREYCDLCKVASVMNS